MNPVIAILLVLIGVILGAAIIIFVQKRRSARLAGRFGPEYDRVLRETGDSGRTDEKLEKRQKRIEQLTIRPLSADERLRFQQGWRGVQSQFVDDPRSSLERADDLITQVMVLRGYPVEDFEQRADDISVNHPRVVQNFRTAHSIALRAAKREASTEDIRQAMVNYRALFDDLVGSPETVRAQTA